MTATVVGFDVTPLEERQRTGVGRRVERLLAALVRQPFGGFGLSGCGTKAGGDTYLHNFVVSRAICENTMRRGFAPELD